MRGVDFQLYLKLVGDLRCIHLNRNKKSSRQAFRDAGRATISYLGRAWTTSEAGDTFTPYGVNTKILHAQYALNNPHTTPLGYLDCFCLVSNASNDFSGSSLWDNCTLHYMRSMQSTVNCHSLPTTHTKSSTVERLLTRLSCLNGTAGINGGMDLGMLCRCGGHWEGIRILWN